MGFDLPLDIKDYSNKNILHYLAMSAEKNQIHQKFLSKINKSYDKLISEQDSKGRTPLHYAAMSGTTSLIKNDFWNITFQPKHYMIRDKFHQSVLDILVHYMPTLQPRFGKYSIRFPYDCNFDDLFKTPGCSDERMNILDDFEMFAFRALTDLKRTTLVQKRSVFIFMQEALKKNRFYILHMIKVIFPKLYNSVTKSKVNFFLSLILKKSSHPNAILSSTFLPDLMKYACESKEQYGHLWYMFYDRQRQFWPIYLTWKRSHFFNIVNVVLRNCSQINLFEAAMKGGNILPVVKTGIRKSVNFDIQHVFRIAPCIITNSKYLTPQLDFTSKSKYSEKQDIELYSHPFLSTIFVVSQQHILWLFISMF